jgi:DNA polymerase III alpha subunit
VLSRKPLVQRADAFVKGRGLTTIAEHESRKKAKVFGQIAGIKPHVSKNGNPMWKVWLDDGMDSLMFFVFEKDRQAFKDHFREGVIGAVPLDRFDDGGMRFFDGRGECEKFTESEVENAQAG